MLPQYPSVQLVTVAYGDDLSDKKLPRSGGSAEIISGPESHCLAVVGGDCLPPRRAVKDQGKIGKVYVTGLGLPSEMAGAIKSGASKSFAHLEPD
ncbi:L-rhamnose ABC transporter [Klebsiella pneumoniae]|uniref:L-rhamnose ABC transporter n=1 Tax=Klebsiella pneumoniae TaxID=573 RepID=A0A447RTW5_KLEPN|nr:L-rhamnose ABC transporter [Klebsiella pneumoniae]